MSVVVNVMEFREANKKWFSVGLLNTKPYQVLSSLSSERAHQIDSLFHIVFYALIERLTHFEPACSTSRTGIAQWLKCWTPDWKVPGSSPCRSGGRIFFSRVNFLCWLLFWYPFYPCVTTVAHKKSWSFCQKWKWEVIAKHACTLHN